MVIPSRLSAPLTAELQPSAAVFYATKALKIKTAIALLLLQGLDFPFERVSSQFLCRVEGDTQVFLSCPVVMGLWMLLLQWLNHFELSVSVPWSCPLHTSRLIVKVLSFWWLCLSSLETWSKNNCWGFC